MKKGKAQQKPSPKREARRQRAIRYFGRIADSFGTVRGVLAIAGPFAIVVGLLVALLFAELRELGLTIAVLGLIAAFYLVLTWVLRPHDRVARRQQRYGLTTTVSILALVGIVALVNVIAINSNVLADMTASRQYSLAPQTLDVLTERLTGQVEAVAFVVDEEQVEDPVQAVLVDRMIEYLREFERRSAGRFSYRVVDPERFPDVAYEKGVAQWPSVAFEHLDSGRRQIVQASANPEQDFLTALLVVSGLGQKQIYVLDGYSAWDLENEDVDARQAFGFGMRGLLGDSYAVNVLDLLQQPEIPDDAALVIVVGPTQEMGANDGAVLNAYLENGGKLLVLLEPNSPPSWRQLVARWGIAPFEGYVIDPASHVAGEQSTPLVGRNNYVASDIAPDLGTTFFPGLAPLSTVRPPADMPTVVDLKPMATTSEGSFASDNSERVTQLPDDLVGPFMVGAVVRAQGPVDRPIVPAAPVTTLGVFGDADFVSNRYFYAFSNSDLFLNVVNHMTGDDALISIRPKPTVFREMAMTPREFTFLRYVGWFLLPLLVAIGGLVAWWRRR